MHGRTLVATQWPPTPAADPGTPVRAVFHARRHVAAAHLNALVTDAGGLHGTVPTTGLLATQRWVLGAVCVSQVAVWSRHEQGLPLNVGRKAFLPAA